MKTFHTTVKKLEEKTKGVYEIVEVSKNNQVRAKLLLSQFTRMMETVICKFDDSKCGRKEKE